MVNGCLFQSSNNTKVWIAVSPNPRISMVEEIPENLVKITANDGSVTVSDSWEDVMERLSLQVVSSAEDAVHLAAPKEPKQAAAKRVDGSRA